MKKMTYVKHFNSEYEIKDFMENMVGDDRYWKVRAHWVEVENLKVTVKMQMNRYHWHRATKLIDSGFEFVGRV